MKTCRRKNNKLKFALVVVLILTATLYVVYRVYTVPKIVQYADSSVDAKVVSAVNQSVYSATTNVDLSKLTTVERDTDGNVVLIATNSSAVGYVSAKTVENVTQALGNNDSFFAKVPLGVVIPSPLFSGIQAPIKVKIKGVSYVTCALKSEFTSAGINQTLHRLFLNVTVRLDVVMPCYSTQTSLTTPVLLCESVIVGKVPQFYLGGDK